VSALIASIVGVSALAYFKVLDPTYIEGLYNGIRNRMADVNLKRGDVKRDCGNEACPEMVVLPPGEFMMGSSDTEEGHLHDEEPRHNVTVGRPFLVSKHEVTFAEWDACYDAGGCSLQPSDDGWGRGKWPVINVSWNDIQQYLKWLSTKTGMPYRLLTEAEWEYAARGITEASKPHPRYSWGDDIKRDGEAMANCDGCGSQWDKKQTAPVGSFKPNPFGLYDMHGNVWEWVQDCYAEYAPADGSAPPDEPNCSRVQRGGSWISNPGFMRAANRSRGGPGLRYGSSGFRVARDLPAGTN
jgi:formylglycine-generating enzyme required for sulfatase activity